MERACSTFMRRCLTAWSLAILVAIFPSGAHAAGNTAACAALAGRSFDDDTVITARMQAKGPVKGTRQDFEEDTTLPEHCLVRGSFGHRRGINGQSFAIGFELRLPTRWNGRFVFEGGGGMDGVAWPAYGSLFNRLKPVALARGYAVVRTDSGHLSPEKGDAQGTFALDQQARLDYAFVALDKVTGKAKALVARYYGRPPSRSYFMGCSNGGRQAMLMAQRFPAYFDGIVAGDPSFNISHLSIWEVWNQKVLAGIAPRNAAGAPVLSRAFSDENLRFVRAAVLKACDGKDGLVDGMINDVTACRFDPAETECSRAPGTGCLSPEQVAAMRSVMEGPRDEAGRALSPPFPYDTGIVGGWRGVHLGSSPTPVSNAMEANAGLETLRFHSLTPPAPRLEPGELDVARAWKAVRQTAAMNDADWTFLNSFAAQGKLLLYQGVSDYGLSSNALAAWYQQAGEDSGGNVQDWARLFLVPGMGHCDGGESADQFDPLQAVQDWVEQGRAPDRIVATGKHFPGVSRPLCPWPRVARYKGGAASEAGSFTCS